MARSTTHSLEDALARLHGPDEFVDRRRETGHDRTASEQGGDGLAMARDADRFVFTSSWDPGRDLHDIVGFGPPGSTFTDLRGELDGAAADAHQRVAAILLHALPDFAA